MSPPDVGLLPGQRPQPTIASVIARRLGLAGLALIVAFACGAASTTPTPTPDPTATTTAPPSPTATAAPVVLHDVVYLARDRLPPVGAHVPGAGSGATAQQRIISRLNALLTAAARPGLFNVARASTARAATAAITGDLATVDFTVPNGQWGVAGSAGTLAFLQQLVYTATEEPGIRRVLITQNGGEQALINGEGLVIDHPVARENVAGYSAAASQDRVRSYEAAEPPLVPAATVSSRYSVDSFAPALARLVVELERAGSDARWLPTFDVGVAPSDADAKWDLVLTVYDGQDTPADTIVDRTPLRRLSVETAPGTRHTTYRLALDDLRPWRVGVVFDPVRLILDVGGDPGSVNSNVAVYRPLFNTGPVGGRLSVSGMARAFEASYEYRLTDTLGAVLARGHGMASYGTSPIWGAFDLEIADVPERARNLEVFLRSPRDGEITDLVSVPLSLPQ